LHWRCSALVAYAYLAQLFGNNNNNNNNNDNNINNNNNNGRCNVSIKGILESSVLPTKRDYFGDT